LDWGKAGKRCFFYASPATWISRTSADISFHSLQFLVFVKDPSVGTNDRSSALEFCDSGLYNFIVTYILTYNPV